MPDAGIIRLEPTMSATGVIVHTWAVGMPAFSSSTTIAAPLRVLVPQVEVKITPSTPSAFSSLAKSCPALLAISSGAPTPAVA